MDTFLGWLRIVYLAVVLGVLFSPVVLVALYVDYRTPIFPNRLYCSLGAGHELRIGRKVCSADGSCEWRVPDLCRKPFWATPGVQPTVAKRGECLCLHTSLVNGWGLNRPQTAGAGRIPQ
jgi:hypothetical protein